MDSQTFFEQRYFECTRIWLLSRKGDNNLKFRNSRLNGRCLIVIERRLFAQLDLHTDYPFQRTHFVLSVGDFFLLLAFSKKQETHSSTFPIEGSVWYSSSPLSNLFCLAATIYVPLLVQSWLASISSPTFLLRLNLNFRRDICTLITWDYRLENIQITSSRKKFFASFEFDGSN